MNQKHYNTTGRKRRAAYLKQTKNEPPQSAEEIYTGLCKLCGANAEDAPGRSSVYRMLAAMSDGGEVKKFPAGIGESGFVYQYVGNDRHCNAHFHLHCLACGQVTHLDCRCGDEMALAPLRSHGFTVDRGRSILYGICELCAKRGDA